MTRITAEKKDEIFRHPQAGEIHFGRHVSIATQDRDLWAVVQMGQRCNTRVLIVHAVDGQPRRLIMGLDGKAHQPCLAVSPQGEVAVIWNEAVEDGWHIRCARVNAQKHALQTHEVVYASKEVCLPPTAAFDGDVLHVAWSGRSDGRLRIHTMMRQDDVWTRPARLSSKDVDAWRPHISADGGHVVLAWDEYRDHRYHIVVAQRREQTWYTTATLGQLHERWLHPRTTVGSDGSAYVVWVVLKPVTDKLGIIDHWPMGMVARIESDQVIPLNDTARSSDPRMVADLRDGLLASKIYKGYVGLRRNPFLSINDRSELWCVWEIRGESEGSTVAGPLLGRRLNRDNGWDAPVQLVNAGYGYAVPRRFVGDALPFAMMNFDKRGVDVIDVGCAEFAHVRLHSIDESRWRRWRVEPIPPEPKHNRTIDVDGKSYRFFWADTHVHTIFSPDAEGELDELVHYARDQAGLDILTLIDNDYYPHKALTESEWQIHQALADHFTEEGKFIWMPGYEFTYHRADLTPDFNHRCVIYPLGSGPLHRRIDPGTASDHTMIPTLKAAGAMPYPHHCTYELIDNDAEWNVEVVSSWRVCIEETDHTIRQLQAGKRLGFIGSSDTHRAVPGLGGARTGVLATELTRAAVLDAYRQRRLIATQGHNLYIDFQVNGATVGSKVDVEGAPMIRVAVEAPEPIDYLELVRDGQVIHELMPKAPTCTFRYRDDLATSGKHFYFLRIKLAGDPSFNRDGFDPSTNNPQPFSQDSRYPHNLARARGPFAWTSPIWVTLRQGKTRPGKIRV